MDDPWGSPWAADVDKGRDHPRSTLSSLEPPPRAFLTKTPPLPTFSTQSPWAADDDGYGDWAIAESNACSDGWGGQAADRSAPQLLTPSTAGFGASTTSLAWPEAAASPGVKTLSRSSSSLFRQPSPDPWAIENNSLEGRDGQEGEGTRSDVHRPEQSKPPSVRRGSASPAGNEAGAPPWGRSADGEPRAVSSDSRRSSTASQDSCGDGRQDSPITSVDDDSRPRPPSQQRTASSKVQELVTMFDDLAKSDMVPIERRAGHSSPGRRFSDGTLSQLQPAPENTAAQSPSSSNRTATPGGQQGCFSTEDGGGMTAPGPLHLPPKASTTFDVDMDNVGRLFDHLQPPPEFSASDTYVPDSVLVDSFTETSERRLWYRISRRETMRRYDAGDDEAYCRVGWVSSAARDGTLKIIRRWMEEDSLGGRPTLGGSGHKGSIFGWDSTGDSVALDEVFGRNRSRRPSPRDGSTVHPTSGMNGVTPATTKDAQVPSNGAGSTAPGMRVPVLSDPATPVGGGPAPEDRVEDDEWGEMESSPQKQSQATLAGQSRVEPPLRNPQHASRGLGSTVTKAAAATVPSTPGLPVAAPNRRPAPDLDTAGEFGSAPSVAPVSDMRLPPQPEPAAHARTIPGNPGAESTPARRSEEDTLASILDGLPDLSYMLR